LDFHHGNGTQDIFYETDSVLFVSLHHTPHGAYPYFSGFEDEIGYHTSTARHTTRHTTRHSRVLLVRSMGKGEGFNINYPLEAGTDEDTYTAVLNTVHIVRVSCVACALCVVSHEW
jgi:acetoin utilization deacetylase AcuC-like enzyme